MLISEVEKMKRRKKQVNPTVTAMRQGGMTMTVRMTMQMWHQDHIAKNAEHLERLAGELRRIDQSNSMRGVDKAILAQRAARDTHWDLQHVLPADPRGQYKGQRMEYVGGRTYAVDTNGHDELLAREDLNEPVVRPDYDFGRE
jgi:hypothetical protein